MPRAITKLPIPTAAAAKNYPPIVPTPLSSSLTSKTHELQQEALLMPRAITKLPIPTAAAAKNYPPIVPTPLSSSLTSKTHELQQEALLMPRAITKLPIRPANQASPELIVSVNVTKNHITKGEPQVFRIAIHDTNSNNNIGNARISGIVLIQQEIQFKISLTVLAIQMEPIAIHGLYLKQ